MADFGGDDIHETEDLDISQIILLQAALRGALVRKWMKEVKQAFGDAFAEIERNADVDLEWKSGHLCKPRVGRTKDKLRKKSEKQTDEPTALVQNIDLNDHSRKISNSKNIKKKKHIVTDLPKEGRAGVVSGKSDESLSEIPKNVNESPKYNSVEIQTSFIDINFQTLPDRLKTESEQVTDKEENFLEDLDTSWKDRVEPFLENNFGELESTAELKKDDPNADELHLDLDIDTESMHSHKSSPVSSKNTEILPVLTANSDDSVKRKGASDNEKQSGFEYVKTESGRESRKSDRSDSSSRRKNIKGDELTQSGQRSSKSDEHSSESRKRTSNTSQGSIEREELPHSSWSDKRSEKDQLSNRSDKSSGRSQRLLDTDRFSPQGQRSSRSEISESGSKGSRESEKGLEGQLTHRSDGGGKRSHRSDGSLSHRSDRSGDRKSQSSQRSRQGKGQKSEMTEENEKKQLCTSPVQFQHSRRDRWNEESPRQGRPPIQDSTNLTNVTSVWDSFSSVKDSHDVEMPNPLPQDPAKLKELRKNIAMELLWVQQAIDSRKNYLKLKGKM